MTLRITADRELCIGAENCHRYAASTFETDSAGKVVVNAASLDAEAQIRLAVTACPTGALTIEEDRQAER